MENGIFRQGGMGEGKIRDNFYLGIGKAFEVPVMDTGKNDQL